MSLLVNIARSNNNRTIPYLRYDSPISFRKIPLLGPILCAVNVRRITPWQALRKVRHRNRNSPCVMRKLFGGLRRGPVRRADDVGLDVGEHLAAVHKMRQDSRAGDWWWRVEVFFVWGS